jgi:hypothetical protein
MCSPGVIDDEDVPVRSADKPSAERAAQARPPPLTASDHDRRCADLSGRGQDLGRGITDRGNRLRLDPLFRERPGRVGEEALLARLGAVGRPAMAPGAIARDHVDNRDRAASPGQGGGNLERVTRGFRAVVADDQV